MIDGKRMSYGYKSFLSSYHLRGYFLLRNMNALILYRLKLKLNC